MTDTVARHLRLPTAVEIASAVSAGDGEITRIRDDRSTVTIGRSAAPPFPDDAEYEYPPTTEKSTWLE
jgi:hypothetical protein